jgi:hypothetical protein
MTAFRAVFCLLKHYLQHMPVRCGCLDVRRPHVMFSCQNCSDGAASTAAQLDAGCPLWNYPLDLLPIFYSEILRLFVLVE